jgi:hypothetical protein
VAYLSNAVERMARLVDQVSRQTNDDVTRYRDARRQQSRRLI